MNCEILKSPNFVKLSEKTQVVRTTKTSWRVNPGGSGKEVARIHRESEDRPQQDSSSVWPRLAQNKPFHRNRETMFQVLQVLPPPSGVQGGIWKMISFKENHISTARGRDCSSGREMR